MTSCGVTSSASQQSDSCRQLLISTYQTSSWAILRLAKGQGLLAELEVKPRPCLPHRFPRRPLTSVSIDRVERGNHRHQPDHSPGAHRTQGDHVAQPVVGTSPTPGRPGVRLLPRQKFCGGVRFGRCGSLLQARGHLASRLYEVSLHPTLTKLCKTLFLLTDNVVIRLSGAVPGTA